MKTFLIIYVSLFLIGNVITMAKGVSKYGENWYIF